MFAVAYARTSSATNVGEDKDSLPRQMLAIQAYADANDLIHPWPAGIDAYFGLLCFSSQASTSAVRSSGVRLSATDTGISLVT